LTTLSVPMTNRLDAAEAVAYRDMFAAAPRTLATSLALEVQVIDGAMLFMAPGLPTPMFNRVIGLGNLQAVGDRTLDTIAGAYRRAGIKSWWIHVSPGTNAENLVARLAARGFQPPVRRAWVKMVRDTSLPQSIETTLDVRRVGTGEERAFAETFCASFDMPLVLASWFARLVHRQAWQAVGAFREGELVGCGLLHVQDEIAWLGAGGVRPEARRHHAHRAMMNLRLQMAIDSGSRLITTETGEPVNDEPNPSLRNMVACGFQKNFSRINLAAPA